MTPAALTSLSPSGPALSVNELRKDFGRMRVLADVSIEFPRGSITALVGPNGAGKTTLIKCLLGLVRPDRGSTIVDGEVVGRSAAYRHDIGFMPQLPNFPPHLTGRELAEMIDDLRDFDGVPDEELLDTLTLRPDLDKPFNTLSGGTRQKVNAALAFRYRCPVLILDEPTAGLDPIAAMALKAKVVQAQKEGATVLVTSHNLSDLQTFADRIAFLLDGRLRFAGPLAELLEQTGQPSLEEAVAELMRRHAPEAPTHPQGRPKLVGEDTEPGVA